MRISDWSSDVCSSDLRGLAQAHHRLLADPVEAVAEADGGRRLALAGRRRRDRRHQDELAVLVLLDRLELVVAELGLRRPALHQRVCRNAELSAYLGEDRQRVVKGKTVSVRVALGGPRITTNNHN